MDDARRARSRRALSRGNEPQLRTLVLRGVRSGAGGSTRETRTEEMMSHVQGTDDVGLESSFTSSDKRTLTDVEVAARLGVSRFTVRSWRLKGLRPRFLKMGRAVRYRPQDVDDYERQALVETQAQSERTRV